MVWISKTVVAIALLFSIGSTLSVYPHQLAYFNEVAGGPENGHKHLLGSNLGWGQDLLEMKQWLTEHSELSGIGTRLDTSHRYPLVDLFSPNMRRRSAPHRDLEIIDMTEFMSATKEYRNHEIVDRIAYSLVVVRFVSHKESELE